MVKKSIILLVVFMVLSIYLNTFYRDFIYLNKIDDFGLADVGYNIFAVTLVSLTSWIGLFRLTNNKILDILIHTLIYISIEITGFIFPIFGIFDFNDIIALLISCVITLSLFYLLDKKDFIKSKNILIMKAKL